MRPIDGDALLEKFNRKADIMTALTDEDTANDFAFYCKLADAVEEMPTICGWISVKDRLPEEETEYLCWFGDFPMGAFARVCRWNKIRGAFWCYLDNAKWAFVTHWMPLPEPPKDGDGDER